MASQILHEETFKAVIQNAYSITKSGILTDIHHIGNIPWRLWVREETLERTGYIEQIVFYLCCEMKNESTFWNVTTNESIRLGDITVDVKNSSFNVDNRFIMVTHLARDKLFYPNSGYIKNNKLEIEVTVAIKKVVGFQFFHLDFSKPSDFTDASYVIEEKTIYINRIFLSMHSAVLKNFFFGDINNAVRNQFDLNVKYEDFVNLLKVVYPGPDEINIKNVENILALAVRFGFSEVIHKCEMFLKKTNEMNINRKFEIADKYVLADLHVFCLESLNAADIRSLKSGKLYKFFKHQSKDALIEKLLRMSK